MDKMLDQLRQSLNVLESAKKMQSQVLNKMINKLPKDKRRHALSLLEKAKTGKINLNEIMCFAGKIPDKAKNDIEQLLKKADDHIK